jgi:hypothetical protein
MAFLLQLNGVRRPLLDWGITSAVLTREAFAPDTLAFTVAAQIGSTRPFVYGQTIELYADNVRRFVGRITETPAQGEARSERLDYVASGPWWDLANLVYQEARFLYAEPDNPQSELVEVFSSRAVLFNALDGSALTAGQQAVQAVNYARTKGAALQVGTIELPTQVMWEELNDVSVAEVIKKCVRWTSDAMAWFDYTTNPPSLNIRRRAALSPLTIDLAAADADKLVTTLDIRPNHAAVAPGVRFFYEGTTVVTAPRGPTGRLLPGILQPPAQTRTRYLAQSAGNPDAIGAVIAVIELSGFGTETPEPIPPTLAADYYSAISTLNYDGTLGLRQVEAASGASPALRLNLTGGEAAWASMGATIQRVTEDLLRGSTTLTLGQPDFLGAQSFADYLAYRKQTNKTNYLTAKRTGEATSGLSLFYGSQILPPSAGDYVDALEPVEPDSVRLRCRTRGGTASMGGFNEFIPSFPPQKYLTRTSAGAVRYQYLGGGTSSVRELAGVQTIDPATGVITGTLPVAWANCCAGPSGDGFFGPNWAFGGPAGIYITTQTATVRSWTSTGTGGSSCCFIGGGYVIVDAPITLTLSDPDTEEAAIARLLASAPNWSEWTESGCSSRRDARAPNVFSFEYRDAEIWLQAFGLEPGTPHAIKVNVMRTDLAGGFFPTSFAMQLTFTSSTDTEGALDITFTLPTPPSGFGYSVGGVEFAA